MLRYLLPEVGVNGESGYLPAGPALLSGLSPGKPQVKFVCLLLITILSEVAFERTVVNLVYLKKNQYRPVL